MDGGGDHDLWISRRSVPPPLPRAVPPPLPAPTPWHGWWTLLWAVAVMGLWMTFQSILVLGYLAIDGTLLTSFRDAAALEAAVERLSFDGDFLGVTTILTALITCPLCFLIGKWRAGFTGVSYLGLELPKTLPMLMWVGIIVAVGFGLDFVMRPFVADDEVPEFMVNAINSSEFPLFLILGVVLGAPFLEEFVFRGLLFKGWRHSALGLWGTILLTSLLWTALHVQYDIFGLAFIFVLGLVIGYAREKTGNLWVPIAMHAANNLLATMVAFEWLE